MFFFAVAVFAFGAQPSVFAYSRVTLSPSNLNFGGVSVGQSATLPATLTNNGSNSVTVYSIYANDSEFTVQSASLPMTLSPGRSLALKVTYHPTNTGTDSATISFKGTWANLAVQGTGQSTTTSGSLTTNPRSVSFGSVQDGNSATASVTITNNKSRSVTIASQSTTGAGFSVQGLSLPLTLSSGESYTFKILFAPLSAGSVSGAFQAVYGRNSNVVSIPLTGTGTGAGQLSLSPASVSFGNVTVGSNMVKTGSLTAASASVTVTSVSSSSSEFVISGLSLPKTIAAGQSASFSITFTPQSSGAASGTIAFASSANSPAESLTGMGVAPVQHSVSLSWNPSSTSNVSGYNVYRGTASGGPYAKLSSIPGGGTSYLDTAVSTSHTYYYVTTAVNSSGQESSYSNQVQVAVP